MVSISLEVFLACLLVALLIILVSCCCFLYAFRHVQQQEADQNIRMMQMAPGALRPDTRYQDNTRSIQINDGSDIDPNMRYLSGPVGNVATSRNFNGGLIDGLMREQQRLAREFDGMNQTWSATTTISTTRTMTNHPQNGHEPQSQAPEPMDFARATDSARNRQNPAKPVKFTKGTGDNTPRQATGDNYNGSESSDEDDETVRFANDVDTTNADRMHGNDALADEKDDEKNLDESHQTLADFLNDKELMKKLELRAKLDFDGIEKRENERKENIRTKNVSCNNYELDVIDIKNPCVLILKSAIKQTDPDAIKKETDSIKLAFEHSLGYNIIEYPLPHATLERQMMMAVEDIHRNATKNAYWSTFKGQTVEVNQLPSYY